MKLIDKDALVAEIERRMQCYSDNGCEPNAGKWVELISIKHFLDTLETKGVDLDKAKNVIRDTLNSVTRLGSLCTDDIIEHAVEDLVIALGLKAKQG